MAPILLIILDWNFLTILRSQGAHLSQFHDISRNAEKMAVELEKLLEESREEICVHIVAQVSSEMATYEALPVEDVRLGSSLVAELNEASVRNEGQIWDDFVNKPGSIVLGSKQDLGPVQDTTGRSTERFMFEPRAGVDQVYEKPCAEMVSQ